MTSVITYRLVYFGGRKISLCDKHAAAPEYACTLGGVLHGSHDGDCYACGVEAREAAFTASNGIVLGKVGGAS